MDNDQNNKQNTRKPGAEVGARSSRPPESPGAATEEQKWSAIYNNNAAQGVRRARSGGRRKERRVPEVESQQPQRRAYNSNRAQNQRRMQRRASRLARRLSHEQSTRGQGGEEKLSGFGFKMILGVAIIKDVFDVVSGFLGTIILSFGSSVVLGVVASQYLESAFFGWAAAAILQALKFTGIGTIIIGSANMGLFMMFVLSAILFSFLLQFSILTYLTFQGVFGLQRGLARKLAVVSISLIMNVLPLINWLPETTAMLLILRRFDKKGAEKEKRRMRATHTSALPAKQFV